MDEILETAEQFPEIQFVVSPEDLGQPYYCTEWGDLYESFGAYGNDPLVINSGAEHPVWEWFAGHPYSAYAFLDHNMVVRQLLSSPNGAEFTTLYIPELLDRMYGCTDPSACNADNEAVYDDGSCDYSCQNETELTFSDEQPVYSQNNVHQKFPEAVTASDGSLHLVWVNELGNTKNCMTSFSTDGGATFSEPIRVNHHANSLVAYTQAGPKIKEHNGILYVIYMDNRSGLTNIYLNYSTDNGITWSEDLRVSDQNYLQAYADLEIDPTGNLHLVYYSYNQNYSFHSVRYASSLAGTVNFSYSIPVGIHNDVQEPCDCCQPDLASDSDGNLYLAFRNNINNIRDSYIAVKPAGSEAFTEQIQATFYNDYVSHCPSSGPSLSIEDGRVVLAVRVSDEASSRVSSALLSDMDFAEEVDLNSTGGSQNYPHILLNNGNVHAVWIDDTEGNPDVFYGVSYVGSGVMQNVQRMNQNIEESYILQKDPYLHVANGTFSVFWSDKRGSFYQLYYRQSDGSYTMPGDINGDGVANILDIVQLVNIILELSEDNGLADLNGDGAINILDVVVLVNIILD